MRIQFPAIPILSRHTVHPVFGSAEEKPKSAKVKTIQPDLFTPLRTQTPGLKRFAVIGDAGSGTDAQYDIGEQMAKTYAKKPFASVLVLGDNIYEDGEPKYFKSRIYKPYKELFQQGVRFYPVMGNHDVRLGYAEKQRAYWGVPQFYSQRVGNVEFFALDTTVFLPDYDRCHTDNPFRALQEAKTQLQWLDKVLEDSTAKYKVVLGHYPVYSSGLHGVKDDSTLRLRAILEPVFVKHGVDAYLSGHEHHYEKSRPIQGVHHFVSGAGGKLRRNVHYKDNPPYPREKLIAKYHFMLFEETDQGLKYEVVSKKGNILDSGVIRNTGSGAAQVRFA